MGLPYPKQLAPFGGKTLIEATLSLFAGLPLYVPVPESHWDAFEAILGNRVVLVAGGPTRYESVRNGVAAIEDLAPADLILIHDAARPFLDSDSLQAAWALAEKRGAVIYSHPAVDTIKQVQDDGRIAHTLDRKVLVHAQTPQIFTAELLLAAYEHHDRSEGETPPTDEALLLERAGIPVFCYPSAARNQKLTHREDMSLLKQEECRVGHGYDVHRFTDGRPLYLGGVHIQDSPGLAGHSDADVVIHALMDALLGAAGKGDIGHWFPDDDAAFKNIRSTELLSRVWAQLKQSGYSLGNADLTIEAQVPKLAPHMEAMILGLSRLMDATSDQVNVKATTTEGLGFVGRKEGIAATAVVVLKRGRQ